MGSIECFLSFIYKLKTFPLIIQITIVLTIIFIVVSIALMITINNIILTFLTFLFYSLYVYFFEFNINERRYQKIIKESKKIDNQ